MKLSRKTKPHLRNRDLFIAAAVLALGVLTLDILTVATAVSVFYSLIILLFLRSSSPAHSFITASVLSVLIAVGTFLPLSQMSSQVISNHLFALLLVWVCAFFTHTSNAAKFRDREFSREIKRGQERLRRAIQVARGMVYELSCPSGEIRDVEGLEELTGRTVEDLKGRHTTWFDWIHPDDLEPWYKKIQKAADDPSVNSLVTQYRLRHKDGRYILIEDNTSFVRGKNGEVAGVLGVAFDITKRRQIEEALEESQRNYHLIADALPVLIAYIDGEQRFQFANATFERWFGIPPQRIKGKYVWDVIGRSNYSLAYPHVEKALQGEQTNFELPMRDLHRHQRLPDVTLLPRFTADGRIAGMYALMVDMTERKQTEKLLTARLRELAIVHALSTELTQAGELEDIYQSAVRAVLDATSADKGSLLLFDDDRVMRFKAWHGLSEEYRRAVEGHTPWQPGEKNPQPVVVEDMMEDESLKDHREAFAKEGIRALAFIPLVYKDRLLGKFMIYYTTPHEFLRSELRIVSTIGNQVAFSIEQKRFEQMLQKLNATLEKRVFERTAELQQQSEQLRLLANQLTETEQRERKKLAELIHDHLQQLIVAAKMNVEFNMKKTNGSGANPQMRSAQKLLEEALDSCRSLTGELRPPVLYEDGLRAALKWLAARCKKQYGLDIRMEFNVKTEPIPEETKAMLYESVRELFFNIVKYASVNEAKLSMWLNEQYFMISVEDGGHGFDTTSIDQNTKRGSFGLFSIRERLRAMGGSMRVESRVGDGTKVLLIVPTMKTVRRMPYFIEMQEAIDGKVKDSVQEDAVRILLVDDHKIVREGIAGIIQENPMYKVIAQASDGEEALEMARDLKPDVIVMDVNMPKMNGIEATRRIKRENPQVKIIGLSVQDEDSLTESIKAAGATAHLNKGAAPEALLKVISLCLQ